MRLIKVGSLNTQHIYAVCVGSLVPSPPPQLSLLAVHNTLFILQVTIAVVEDKVHVQGYICVSPAFNETSALQCSECSSVIEIITQDFVLNLCVRLVGAVPR